MAAFGSVVLWNAVLAVLLAGVVLLLSQLPALKQRPAVRQALWLLVLAKLIAPPLIQVPLPWPDPFMFQDASTNEISSLEAAAAIDEREVELAETPNLSANAAKEHLRERADQNRGIARRDGVSADQASSARPALSAGEFLAVGLPAVSLGGTVVLVMVVLIRTRRINRILSQTQSQENHFEQESSALARKLGLPFEPAVRIVDTNVTPMLWAHPQQPVVVLPERLVAQLDQRGVESVIAHELAHWIRQDHWTNMIAFAVAACFWWNPISWFAYRQMREAQEECCDALLLAHGTAERRQYAETLLAVLDFQTTAGPAIPLVSPGIGGTYSLRRRFEMLRDRSVDHRLTWLGKALVAATLMLLPSMPTWSQPDNPPADLVAQSTPVATSGPAESKATVDVQDLIDTAKPGGVVVVPAGTYTEPVTIDKPLTLRGEDAAKCVLEVTADAPAIYIKTQKQVSLESLTIKWELATSSGRDSGASAVAVIDSKVKLANCRVEALGNIKRSPQALAVKGFSEVDVDNCSFEGFEFAISYSDGAEGRIVDSVVRKTGHCGISVYEGSTLEVTRSIVTGSEFHGIRSTGGKLLVKDNLIIRNNNRGIYLGNKSARGSIINNLFLGNGSGVSAFAETQVTIANNLFLDSGYSGLDTRDGCRLTIKNNIFQNNPRGFVVYPEAGSNQFTMRRNVFWGNATDMENFESPGYTDKVDPEFRAPEQGDFAVQVDALRSDKLGLTNPEVIQQLWQKWESLAAESE